MTDDERNPRHHTQRMKARLQETMEHLREDISRVNEPQLKAMFETSAEVLAALIKTVNDYERKSEAAWTCLLGADRERRFGALLRREEQS